MMQINRNVVNISLYQELALSFKPQQLTTTPAAIQADHEGTKFDREIRGVAKVERTVMEDG